ncbi:hypothetical protein LCGC14_1178740 [marine sediment metagenome]|uniref:Major capsid protein n=1 Tax=marine sediment metagenome TaxID=412755 RepID=A0A0F9PTB1_9ZZZZ
MAIQKEIWIRDIEDVLFTNTNEFLRKSVSHDAFVDNLIVHVPQAGSLAGAVKNRSVFPAPITERTDTTLDYTLDSFSVDPVRIGRIDEVQVSYAKRQSVMKQHLNILMDIIAKEGIFNWASDTGVNQVRTSGSASAKNLPPSATGSRKKLTIADLAEVAQVMDDQNVPVSGRWLMLPAKMYYEVFTIQELIRDDIIESKSLPTAALKKVLNFNIINRASNTMVIYDNAGTPQRKAVGAAGAAADNFGAIAWQEDAVSTALGAIEIFENEKDAVMYGTVISADVLTKTSKLRTNEAGIVTLIQSA